MYYVVATVQRSATATTTKLEKLEKAATDATVKVASVEKAVGELTVSLKSVQDLHLVHTPAPAGRRSSAGATEMQHKHARDLAQAKNDNESAKLRGELVAKEREYNQRLISDSVLAHALTDKALAVRDNEAAASTIAIYKDLALKEEKAKKEKKEKQRAKEKRAKGKRARVVT